MDIYCVDVMLYKHFQKQVMILKSETRQKNLRKHVQLFHAKMLFV